MTTQSGKSNQEFTFRKGLSGIWLFLGVILLIILAMSIFFVVTDITVDGNARYTDEEISHLTVARKYQIAQQCLYAASAKPEEAAEQHIEEDGEIHGADEQGSRD